MPLQWEQWERSIPSAVVGSTSLSRPAAAAEPPASDEHALDEVDAGLSTFRPPARLLIGSSSFSIDWSPGHGSYTEVTVPATAAAPATVPAAVPVTIPGNGNSSGDSIEYLLGASPASAVPAALYPLGH